MRRWISVAAAGLPLLLTLACAAGPESETSAVFDPADRVQVNEGSDDRAIEIAKERGVDIPGVTR